MSDRTGPPLSSGGGAFEDTEGPAGEPVGDVRSVAFAQELIERRDPIGTLDGRVGLVATAHTMRDDSWRFASEL